jgi:hypothetical protein
MKGACVGSCIAQNYYRSGNLRGGYWYCEESIAKGLFTVARFDKSREKNCGARHFHT